MNSERSCSAFIPSLPAGEWNLKVLQVDALPRGSRSTRPACVVFHVLFNKSVYFLMFFGTLLCLLLCESHWQALKSLLLAQYCFLLIGSWYSGPGSPHFYCTNLVWVLKKDLKNPNQNQTKNPWASCSKAVSRVWRQPSMKMVVAVPELVCAFIQSTRWLSFDWILNSVFACTLEIRTVTICKCQERMGLSAISSWITVK